MIFIFGKMWGGWRRLWVCCCWYFMSSNVVVRDYEANSWECIQLWVYHPLRLDSNLLGSHRQTLTRSSHNHNNNDSMQSFSRRGHLNFEKCNVVIASSLLRIKHEKFKVCLLLLFILLLEMAGRLWSEFMRVYTFLSIIFYDLIQTCWVYVVIKSQIYMTLTRSWNNNFNLMIPCSHLADLVISTSKNVTRTLLPKSKSKSRSYAWKVVILLCCILM